MNESRLEAQSGRHDGMAHGVTVFAAVMAGTVWSSFYEIGFATRENTAVFVGVFRAFVAILPARTGRQ